MHRLRLTLIPNNWWVMTGSNRRPSACKADALPAELITPERVGDYRDACFGVNYL